MKTCNHGRMYEVMEPTCLLGLGSNAGGYETLFVLCLVEYMKSWNLGCLGMEYMRSET